MKIDGISGCYEKTRGMFYFARLCSKIRLHAEGKLPADYFDMLGDGFDGRTCRYLDVRYDDGTLITDFDLIEMDECRWYPDMWREARK